MKIVTFLTGFKFIAEKIKQYEADKSQTFLFGFEGKLWLLSENHFVRDKETRFQALCLFA